MTVGCRPETARYEGDGAAEDGRGSAVIDIEVSEFYVYLFH